MGLPMGLDNRTLASNRNNKVQIKFNNLVSSDYIIQLLASVGTSKQDVSIKYDHCFIFDS